MIVSEHFLKKCDPIFRAGFVVHDAVSGFLARHMNRIKIALLAIAHLSLLGLLFPRFAQDFGSFARDILLIIMLASPLSRVFRMKLLYQLMGLRRELGIWFAYLAIVHGLGFMTDPAWAEVFIQPYLSHPSDILPRYVFGILALILTLPLLITSNNLSLRILKGNWKRLHWLAYPMFAFVLLHTFLPSNDRFGGELAGWVLFGLSFGGYVLLKMLAKNNFVAPLRGLIEYVGNRYGEYAKSKV